ncbi:hypothetical protein HPP92_012941 [Vanilla planifolia]|uniref:Uncharacterized protein n=1 Tax=Vanilla planifolia TaxID=51239 RepID=A0A835QTL7_VANPL|nr:hypothetical protein HPP92_012941 [Vanilla planifolia]
MGCEGNVINAGCSKFWNDSWIILKFAFWLSTLNCNLIVSLARLARDEPERALQMLEVTFESAGPNVGLVKTMGRQLSSISEMALQHCGVSLICRLRKEGISFTAQSWTSETAFQHLKTSGNSEKEEAFGCGKGEERMTYTVAAAHLAIFCNGEWLLGCW